MNNLVPLSLKPKTLSEEKVAELYRTAIEELCLTVKSLAELFKIHGANSLDLRLCVGAAVEYCNSRYGPQ